MEIGVPKEIKDREFRVGLTPNSVAVLTQHNHVVVVESNASIGSGFSDRDYLQAGAKIVDDAKEAWDRESVVKVKEPLKSEYQYLQAEQILFTYLHLAADRGLTECLLELRVSAIAYETVELDNGSYLLAPMSIIAGRLAVQFGTQDT